MVEAPSSNLGTSTPLLLITMNGVDRAAKPFRFLARYVHHSKGKTVAKMTYIWERQVNICNETGDKYVIRKS